MKKYFNKKTAFTLAEILIALSIIGALFMFSVPALQNSTADREKHSQLMKIYPIMDNLINLIVLDYIKPENVPFGEKDEYGNDKFAELLVQKLRVGEDCQNTSTTGQGCWAQENFNGINFNTDDSFYKMRLVDGTSMAVKTFKKCNSYQIIEDKRFDDVCALIYVDINSFDPPNKWGKDVFSFIYNKNGDFKPASQEARKIIEKPKETDKPLKNKARN